MAEIVISIIFGIIAIACLTYGICAWHCKGPILMNKYILACDEEKSALKKQSDEDKKADYRFTSKIFFGIALMFFFVVPGVLIDVAFCYLSILTAIILAVTAFIALFKNGAAKH